MSDIIKAMEYEAEYLSCRMSGEYPFHLVDKVKECGFDSISEYYEEKRNKKFNELNFYFIVKSTNDCIEEGFRLLDTKTTGVVFVDCDETFVYTGESKQFNEGYCAENNIPVYPLNMKGGAIVGSDGDFSIGICIPENLGVDAGYMLNKVKELLSKYASSVEVDGNDIMQNGYKVCGTTGYRKNEMYLFIAHFSFSDRTELINEICYVPSTFSLRRATVQTAKTPGFIEGVTREELKHEVAEWLRLK